MGLHRKESQSFNGFGKILTKTIKITKTEIETKEKPQILHFQVKNTGFCQQSEKIALAIFFYFAISNQQKLPGSNLHRQLPLYRRAAMTDQKTVCLGKMTAAVKTVMYGIGARV